MRFQAAPKLAFRVDLAFTLALIISTLVDAQFQKVEIDDQDPRITYLPSRSSWEIAMDPPNVDMGGTHMVTTDPTATATITFTFVNFFLWSPLWPYKVTTDISIDGGAPVTIDLQDHDSPTSTVGGSATAASSIVLSYLTNATAEHTIVFSVHPNDLFAVVDMLEFNVLSIDTSTGTSTSASTSTLPPTSTISSATSATSPTSLTSTESPNSPLNAPPPDAPQRSISPTVIIGVVASLIGFILCLGILILCYRRRRKRQTAQIDFEGPSIGQEGGHPYGATGFNHMHSLESAAAPSRPSIRVNTDASEDSSERLFVSNPDPSPATSSQEHPNSASSLNRLPSYVSRVDHSSSSRAVLRSEKYELEKEQELAAILGSLGGGNNSTGSSSKGSKYTHTSADVDEFDPYRQTLPPYQLQDNANRYSHDIR